MSLQQVLFGHSSEAKAAVLSESPPARLPSRMEGRGLRIQRPSGGGVGLSLLVCETVGIQLLKLGLRFSDTIEVGAFGRLAGRLGDRHRQRKRRGERQLLMASDSRVLFSLVSS